MKIDIKLVLILLVAVVAFIVFQQCSFERQNTKLYDELNNAYDTMKIIVAEDGRKAGRIEALELTTKQMQNLDLPVILELKEDIKNLNIKLRNVKSYSTVNTETHKEYLVPVKDTVINTRKAEYFQHCDSFGCTVAYKFENDSAWNVTETDYLGLKVVIHKKKKFMGWLRKAEFEGTAIADNPATVITDMKIIVNKPKKKRRIF